MWDFHTACILPAIWVQSFWTIHILSAIYVAFVFNQTKSTSWPFMGGEWLWYFLSPFAGWPSPGIRGLMNLFDRNTSTDLFALSVFNVHVNLCHLWKIQVVGTVNRRQSFGCIGRKESAQQPLSAADLSVPPRLLALESPPPTHCYQPTNLLNKQLQLVFLRKSQLHL